jgi:hypothetical protein
MFSMVIYVMYGQECYVWAREQVMCNVTGEARTSMTSYQCLQDKVIQMTR